jgi:hypothetical protein
VRRDRDHLFAYLARGLVHRSSADDTGATAAGATADRRDVGVAFDDRHVGKVDTQFVGRDLGHRGRDALPVAAGTECDGDVSVERDLDVRCFGADQCADAQRGRLDEQ